MKRQRDRGGFRRDQQGFRGLAQQFLWLITQRPPGRYIAEQAVLIGFPCEIRGNIHQIFKPGSRLRQGHSDIGLQSRVTPDHHLAAIRLGQHQELNLLSRARQGE